MERNQKWRMFWLFVAALWLSALLSVLNAENDDESVPAPGSQAFIRWCQNEASSAEYILWMCWLYGA